MSGPFRRWARPLVVVVGTWLLLGWFFYSEDSTLYLSSKPLHNIQSTSTGSKPHWSKLPERFPVTQVRPLPTGSATVPIPKIQVPPPAEDSTARATRKARLGAVKESFRHSWYGYKKQAWLSDEVMPLTGRRKDPFGGWAATLVDALDTLWIMDLRDDFDDAVKACETIDFTTTQTTNINVFETTIRYLGGFLAAYELSGKQYPTLLAKAVEVAELLLCSFDTPNRMPIARWPWIDYMRGTAQTAPSTVLISEIGSLTLEFTKLSQLTGEMKYYDAVQRISDEFEKSQSGTKLPGLWPIIVDAEKLAFNVDNSFTLGGMSDSSYEYFPKQYLLLGGVLEQPRKLYEGFIDVAKKHLFRRAMNPDNISILIPGDARVSQENQHIFVQSIAKGQHLACFVGGMVGVGARIFDRKDDLKVAIELTDGCVWTYNSSASGIGPEIYRFMPCGGVDESQTGKECAYDEKKWRSALYEYWRPAEKKANNQSTEEARAMEADIDDIIRKQRLPAGMVDIVNRKYILRPEAIESVFLMYRMTGDSSWTDKAWDMFLHIENHTRTDYAAASLADTTVADPMQVDKMESFWLAETLKYFFLIFSEWDVISLDEWVLNTEAHPLRRADASR